MNDNDITLEQVGKLKEFAGVSFADAKAALEASAGDLLEALVWLEKMEKIPSAGTASYSTQEGQTSASAAPSAQPDGGSEEQRKQAHHAFIRQSGRTLKRWLIDNRLEAYHRTSGRELQVPIGVAIALLLLSFWVVLLVLVVGFFLGWRYRLAGPDLSREEVNQVMETINDTAGEVVANMKNNLKSEADRK